MAGELSEKNFIQHEFIGLNATIIETPAENLQNVSGKVIDETMNTFKFECYSSGQKKVIIVPKHKTKFRFILPSQPNQKSKFTLELDGTLITKRPEDRIKKLAKLANKLNKLRKNQNTQ